MGQRYTSISDLYKQVKLNESEIIERKLTSQELEDREKIAKKLPMDDFKKRYGKDAMAVKMATATNIVKKKSQNETIEDELGERTGKYSKMNLDKAKKLMGPSKNRKQGIEMVMKGLGTTYKHATQLVDTILGVNPKTGKIESAELDEKYDLYHSTFSGAMQHAYDYAKKKMGITVDKREIDSKVATGPKKPSEGKTNKYRLKGKGGNLQIQVFNKGGSKPFELNMYKEEVVLDETKKIVAKYLDKAGIANSYAGGPEPQVRQKDAEKAKRIIDDLYKKRIIKRNPGITVWDKGPNIRPMSTALKKKLGIKEEVEINEDGHQDVASAIRQCKTITEDAMQIMSKLQSMSPEDSLPTWWTNKLAVASNSMNKMRDYLLVPSVSEQTLNCGCGKEVCETYGNIDEKAGDIPDLKKLIGELQGASKMHLAQSKRVQAHVDMMVRADAKGPKGAGGLQDLKSIVGELEKASQAHLRQSKSIDAHVDFMNKMEDTQIDEALKHTHMVLGPDGRVIGMSSSERQANDIAKNNLRKVRGRVVKLRKPMATTRGDRLIGMLPADNLAEEMKPEDSLSKWKNADAKGYAEKLIKEYGQPDEVTETMLKWNTLGSFGKGERETYVLDESIPHAFPKPHRDYVYTTMNIKVPSDMLDTLGHVTGSIIYDGLKEEVTARCGSLYANAATLGFVRDMVEGKVTTDKDGAKKEYADRITKDPLPKTYDNKMNEDVSYMCGAECVQESYQEMIARIMSQRSMR